ncbi:MAG: putative manganese-dependent inorganic diphosphatase, partial [Methanomicrobiales archaeon]|nr:putative manganese-dependent inorganic diphosphatase [Methanomicrobiales archaeon]
MQRVYVIGHRQPDTDSICSVIGYAELLNHAEPGHYLAARCGEVNTEARFALTTFGLPEPVLIDSVEPDVSDIPALDTRSAREDVPAADVAAMMEAGDMRNIPVVDGEGRLRGLVSEYGLARAYVKAQKAEPLAVGPISPEALSTLLSARILVKAGDRLAGRVYTAIDALHVALSRLTARDVAIVGDNEPAQLSFISAGIAALIVAEGAPVGERVAAAAREKGVTVIVSPLDAFNVGKMIHLSAPADHFMETDLPVVFRDDPLALAKQLVSRSRYRTACVVDRDRRFVGMLSRTALMEEIQKPVILLDHNEAAQAVEGIEQAEILEIVDHHRLGAISTLAPVKFFNDPVGSTSTIIARRFMEAGIHPTPGAAGALLSGVLSDTLVLRMSTTTDADRKAVEFLARIAGKDPMAYGADLVQHGMQLEGQPLSEMLTRDTKRYSLSGREVVIAQVMVPSFRYPEKEAAGIGKEISRLKDTQGVDMYLALFTGVLEDASLL